MELEFDKEINAILRKAQGAAAASDTVFTGAHIDADAIAAFSENALPENAKLAYTQHLADCDRCRKILSRSILMNKEGNTRAASAFAAPLELPAPWYQKLLKIPNLALAMGALIVTFGGILFYIALQNQNESHRSEVSQVRNSEVPKAVANSSSESANMTANSNTVSANSTSPASGASNAASNSSVVAANPVGSPPGGAINRLDSAPATGAGSNSNTAPEFNDNDKKLAAKPMAAAPKLPVPADAPVVSEREKKEELRMTSDGITAGKDDALAKRKQTEDRRVTSRDLPLPASKMGPSRSGPVQNQSNQTNNSGVVLGEMPVTRAVGGKTFHNRDNAWYDSAYHGQGTTNFRRGTEEYKRLDSGLRKIADNLGGTIVVVWKNKAYRIQ